MISGAFRMEPEEFQFILDGLGRKRFLFTPMCTAYGRHIEIITPSSTDPSGLNLRGYIVPDLPSTNNEWEWEEYDAHDTPISYSLCVPSNEQEMKRAYDYLERVLEKEKSVPEYLSEVDDFEEKKLFYKRVVYRFWEWFSTHDLDHSVDISLDLPMVEGGGGGAHENGIKDTNKRRRKAIQALLPEERPIPSKYKRHGGTKRFYEDLREKEIELAGDYSEEVPRSNSIQRYVNQEIKGCDSTKRLEACRAWAWTREVPDELMAR